MRTAIGCLALSLATLVAGRAPARESAGRMLTEAQVTAVIRARIGDLTRCYRQEQPRLGVPAGRIDVYWEVRETGKVSGAYARVDTLGSPDLRQCVESAIQRWSFPRFRDGYAKVTMAFAFAPAGVTFGRPAEAVNAVPDVWGPKAMRALLLRFGPRFVTIGCVAGARSFLARACDTSIARDPRIGVDARYTTDQATAEVARASIHFEHERVDANGFAVGNWPHPPAGTRDESGPLDGFAVWPPAAFKVALTPLEEQAVRDSVMWRCESEPWSPCKASDRSPRDRAALRDAEASWPPLDERRAREVERLLAPVLQRFEGKRRLRLVQTLSVDLDGDGKPEILHNVAVTDVVKRPSKPGGEEWSDVPTTFFFTFAEKEGHLVRVPALTRPSGQDGMDGLVIGWVDMDGDGRPEVMMETPAYEGLTWQLVRFRDGAFRPVAEFGYNYNGEVTEELPPL